MENLQQRLKARIKVTDNGCWEWQGALRTANAAYGCMKWEGKVQNCHRLSFLAFKGEIKEGMLVCHTCDNLKCINPDHLFLGTNSDNMRDCSKKGRLVVPEGKQFEKGEEPHNRALSAQQVMKIREDIDKLYPAMTLKEIAERNEVQYQAVRDMRRQKPKSYYNL